jgi:hypothetical protein
MRRLTLFILFFPTLLQAREANEDSIVQRIILIGDAGALTLDRHHTVVEAVEKLERLDKKTTVIFLGDNLYRFGLPYEQLEKYGEVRAVLDSQANISLHGPRMVYFIPGNHDWMNGQAGGFNSVVRQGRYLNGLGRKNLRFLPEEGCPGPEEIDLGNDVTLVIMDSQWWLHKNYKPGIESDCANKTREELIVQLQDIITRNYRKLVIFACHHPFRTFGIHGGYYTIKQYIFPFTDMQKNLYIPLPLLGSIYPISRKVFGSIEDLAYPDYQNFAAEIDGILKAHPNLIRIAGHEHALEWVVDSNRNYIVSGSGCKANRVSHPKKVRVAAASIGWTRLDIYRDKHVTCTFRAAAPDSLGRILYTGDVLNYSKLPAEPAPDTSSPLVVYHDTAIVSASHQYENPAPFQRVMVGRNYRREWSEPVPLKVFHINKEQGGFRITGAGGDVSSRVLHLADKSGLQYNLRTIDKDPNSVLPPAIRGSVARDVVQDMISAVHPYAPLAVWPLANAAGIISPKPRYYYMPDDPALGVYRPLFANKVCVLELLDPTPDRTTSLGSEKVINRMVRDDDHFVDQKAVLQARLLDMLVGDWDRHLGKWRWGISDTGRGKLYYPIPLNHDEAFFNSNGLIMKFASLRRLPWMTGYKYNYHRFKWLSYTARDFDRIFLNNLTKRDWDTGVREFQTKLTNDAVHDAIGQMPQPVVAIHGSRIEAKLKNRRDELEKYALPYYHFLSHEVQVLGSNKDEQFNITQSDSGILVQVHAKEKGKDTSLLMYSRLFDPKVTREIRLFGFNGADRFDIDPGVRTKMRIRMIGGGGVDTFNIAGKAHSHVYDVNTEPNQLLAHRHTYVHFESNPAVNDFNIQDFTYNFLRFPTFALGYNTDDGPLAGIGIWRRTFGWRKEPYETDNKLSTLIALQQRAVQLNYHSVFVQSIKSCDLLVNADLRRPALQNFFGFGNETRNVADIKYYRARYHLFTTDVLVQQPLFGNVLKLGVGPTYSYYSFHDYNDDNKVLELPEALGLDSARLYQQRQYVGGKLYINVNNLNNELYPSRGINWRTELNTMAGLSGDASKPYTELHSNMDVYASLSDPARVIAVLRIGGGHIFSNDFEFFQSMSVGQDNYLRGFRKNRFSGRSMAYGNIEVRAKLFDVPYYVLPGPVGLIAFNDVARVWTDDEASRKWHDGYGGGLYYIPYNMFFIAATAGFSSEQTIFNFTIGAKLNLTY